jgi:hypothetical protein
MGNKSLSRDVSNLVHLAFQPENTNPKNIEPENTKPDDDCKLVETSNYLKNVKRQFFSMSHICNEKCSKPIIFLAFLSKYFVLALFSSL